MNTEEYSKCFLNKDAKNIKDDYVLSAMLENMDEAERIAKGFPKINYCTLFTEGFSV
jgi:hypothetical protein